MGPVHMTPEQAVEAQRILRVQTAIATHFGTFALADDSMAGPIERLNEALGKSNQPMDFRVLAEGESCCFTDGERSPCIKAAPHGSHGETAR